MTLGGVLFLKQIARNQDNMLRFLTKEKLAFNLEDATTISDYEKEYSLRQQAALFDGKAGARLVRIFEGIFAAKRVVVRRATEDDVYRCYEWINEPQVREQSYNTESIPLTDHENWFRAKLRDENCYYYILELENSPFAQVRFQVSVNEAVLGYLIDGKYRSRGLGTVVLSKGIEAFVVDCKKKVAIAGFVKLSNMASQKSFDKLSFKKEVAAEFPASYKYTMFYEGN
jgi:RimJ/RimL family protein N-acetyltransferase